MEKILLYVITQPKKERFKVKLQNGYANIYINNFDIKEAINELNWALSFWIEERPAKPTTKKGKCGVREFKEICEVYLIKE